MAENITMKQVPGGTVTAKDDRILNDSNIADSGIIYGCDISYTGNNMIHINAGFGIIKGGLFEIDDHTEYIELPASGTRAGQIYLHLDLSADDKLQIVKDTGSPLHEMIQNADANFVNGIYEFQLCTFTATATALQDVTATFSLVSDQVLDTKEEIMANTTPGMKAGALPVKQLFDSLIASDNLQFRFAVDGEGNHGYLGADDSFIPFSSNLQHLKSGSVNGLSLTVYANFEKDETDCLIFATYANGRNSSGEYIGLQSWSYSTDNFADVQEIINRESTTSGSGQRICILKAKAKGPTASVTFRIASTAGYPLISAEILSL